MQPPWSPYTPPYTPPSPPPKKPPVVAIVAGSIGVLTMTCCALSILGAIVAPTPPPSSAVAPSAPRPSASTPRLAVTASDAAAVPLPPPVAVPSPEAGHGERGGATGTAATETRGNAGDVASVAVVDAGLADAGESAAARTVREARAHVATEPTDAEVFDYNAGLVRDLEALRALHLGRRDPEAREVRAAEREVTARQRQIRERVRVAAERMALSVVCGDEAPVLGAWDGELVGSERYLQQTANDPDSIDVENCTTPVLTRRACWVSTCSVRGHNAFGVNVLNRVMFSVAHGRIQGAEYVR